MTIKLIRLTSGEEVIATITDESNDSITFEKPVALYAAEEGKLGFMPYVPYTKAEDGLTIKGVHILFTVDPVDDVLNQYKEATGSIVTPNQGIIV
jgi:predicted enzyme related to lactoylglutathione lyase